MAKYRPRFNDKARAGTVAKRNELKRKKQKQFYRIQDSGPSASQQPDVMDFSDHMEQTELAAKKTVLPLTAAELEQRKRCLKEKLTPAKRMTATKRKRLDKYIERQVRKQERDEILAKFAAASRDDAKYLSLKNLGNKKKTKLANPFESVEIVPVDDSLEGKEQIKEDSPGIEIDVSSSPESEDTNPSILKDNRPKIGGFGFANLPVYPTMPKGNKLTWKKRLGSSRDNSCSESSSLEEDSLESISDLKSISSDSCEAEEDEWYGFDDDEPVESSMSHDSPKTEGQAFATWALSAQKDGDVSVPTPVVEHYKHVPRSEEEEELLEQFEKGPVERGHTTYVHIKRSSEIESARLALPVMEKEQQIMEAIHHNDCVVLTGETGSGKTTQIPQFLLESGYGDPASETPGMIAVTQPRRVAAVSMSARVAEELGNYGDAVGYQIRFDAAVKDTTRIKFVTDGVLLRELSTDFTLSKYSVVIVDEAHERSANTDILIGILSRIVKMRREQNRPLKFVIMSATLRVKDFTENLKLFKIPPPIVSIDSRQYPVAIHFSRHTSHDYVGEAINKVIKIHERLPKGGILVFLTGKNEIMHAVSELKRYAQKKNHAAMDSTSAPDTPSVHLDPAKTILEEEMITLGFDSEEDGENVLNSDAETLEDQKEEEGFDEEYDKKETILHVFPLYSLLPTSEQLKVFRKLPPNHRLCVVATNVAETSLTIPSIRYVVDSGRAKQRVYDHESGIQKFQVRWISKAAANQRSGRAGRTGPGHCYRLYSSAVYERDFDQFSAPEIERMPIEGLLLQMKDMCLHNVVNFPFPSPPNHDGLVQAVKLLKYLGALEGPEEKITPLGRQMALFPLNPRHAKMLLIGNQFDCLGYVIALVAAFSVGNIFVQPAELGIISAASSSSDANSNMDSIPQDASAVPTSQEKDKLDGVRQRYHQAHARFAGLDSTGDVFKALVAVAGYDWAPNKAEYCKENFLRLKLLQETAKLRHQLAYLIAAATRPDAVQSVTESLTKKLGVPSEKQISVLKQIVAAAYIDQVAIRADLIDDVFVSKKMAVIHQPYATLMPTSEKYVYIHPDSILTHSGSQPPDYLVYQYLSLSDAKNAKIRMRPLVSVSGSLLSRLAEKSSLVTFSKPLSGAYAPKLISSNKRESWVVPRMGAAIGSGGVGWDLPPRKVVQVREGGQWRVFH